MELFVSSRWNYLLNLSLADPDFLIPGRIDSLLGTDIYADVLLHGRQCGPPDTPTAFETQFGWVLTGRTNTHSVILLSAVISGDEILHMFWEIEKNPKDFSKLFTEDLLVVRHFKETLSHSETGIPLPKNPHSVNPDHRPLEGLSLLNIHFALMCNSKMSQQS